MSKPFEERPGFLGDQFEDYRSETNDPAYGWEAFAAAEGAEPTRKYWWWIGAGLLLLVGVFLGAYALMPTEEKIGAVGEADLGREVTVGTVTEALDVEQAGKERISVDGAPPVTQTPDNTTKTSAAQPVQGSADQFLPKAGNEERVAVTERRDDRTIQTEATKRNNRPASLIDRLPLGRVVFAAALPTVDGVTPSPAAPARGQRRAWAVYGGGNVYRTGRGERLLQGEDLTGRYEETGLTGWQAGLSYTVPVGERWTLSAGPELRQLRFRSRLVQRRDNVAIYAPGTVDTIFRDRFTGVDEVVTRDTVTGSVTRRLQQYNSVMTVGLPLEVGHTLRVGPLRWTLSGGLRADYLIGRKGLVLDEEERVVPLAEAATFSGLQWGYRLGTQLELPVLRRRWLYLRGGYDGGLTTGQGEVFTLSIGVK